MTWILIIAIFRGEAAGAMTTAEFESRDACVNAGKNFSDAASGNERVAWSCAPKRLQQAR